MEEPTIEAIIESYLLGTIDPEGKIRLEQAMATDPVLAEKVLDSKRAYKAIILERNRLLKEKLKKLDEMDETATRYTPHRWKLMFFMILVTVMLFLALYFFHRPMYIAGRQLLAYPSAQIPRISGHHHEATWDAAEIAFRNKEFESAIQQYVVLMGDETSPVHFEARWNILMAQLAYGGPTSSWHAAMQAYIREAPLPYASRAKALSDKFSSSWYRFFFSPWGDKLSPLKPRLI